MFAKYHVYQKGDGINGLTKEKLVGKLNNILRTATIQGAVKEEYIASEALSRI